MSYKTIHNPIDKEVSLSFRGETHVIGAKESKSFPEDVAAQWLEIYGFMTVSAKADLPRDFPTAEVVEEVPEVVEEVEEVTEEVEEEKVKRGKKK